MEKIKVNEISDKTKKSFKLRVITGLILCAVCIPCMLLGNWYFMSLMILISIGATYEFIHVMKGKGHPIWLRIVVGIITISFVFWILIKNHKDLIDESGNFTLVDITISTLALATLLLVTFFCSMINDKVTIPDVCYYVTMSLLVGIGVQSMIFIRFVPLSKIVSKVPFSYSNQMGSSLLFAYVVIGAFMSDIGAYCFGVLFGKHKMNPRVSPNKTWEGFVGGILTSLISSMIFGIAFSMSNMPLINGLLDHTHWYWILLLSVIMPIVSVLGDFIFSGVKRYYGIKDFSNLLPGHGGILDRIDSLLVTSLIVSVTILTIANFPFVGA